MPDPSPAPSGEPPAPARRGAPRHAAPEDGGGPLPAGHRAAHRRRRDARRARIAGPGGRWLAAGAALLAVAAVVVVVVSDDTARGPGTGSPSASPPAGAAAGSHAPPALLDWLRTELPDGGTVAAPPELRAALLRAGAAAAVLPDPPPGDGNATTPALSLAETQPAGTRLVARFDRGGAPPLLLVDPTPVEPTAEQRRQREILAAAVLANPTTRTEGNSREVLAAADVDARLLALVAALAAQEGVGLGAFPAPPGEEAGAAPTRRVVVDRIGGMPVPADGATTQRLQAWLEAQLAPFAPDIVEVTGDGVLIGFDYLPGPDAVVAAAAP